MVTVIALALFAFIAGDAWKVLQPHQSQNVGEIDGEEVTAQEYQDLVEEYTEMVKMTNGLNSLTDEQNDQAKDYVWTNYVNNKLIENEAEKLGLVVTDAEVKAIINEGTHPILRQSPFVDPQTGLFDKDQLNQFLVSYASLSRMTSISAQQLDSYQKMYRLWQFMEKSLIQDRLAEKYRSLITQSLFSNPVEAQESFNARTQQSSLLLAAIPYTAIPDSTITLTVGDLKKAYNVQKEQFLQPVESRNIKYVDVQVTASPEDRAAIEKEVEEYTVQLAAPQTEDYTTFIRGTGSDATYTDLFLTARAYPTDVAARLDSVAVGGVFGPYYNATDNTINSFKKLAVATMPDSIEFRQIQVIADTEERTKQLADSIFTALKGGADFVEMAKRYGQTGTSSWISSAAYEGAQIDGDNLKYLQTVIALKKNELVNLPLMQLNVILQAVDRKAMVPKYKVAVVKREVTFSKQTYNKAYNDFSQFIAANGTLDKLTANAEDAGYRLLERNDLTSDEHGIGSVRATKDALRWVFGAKPGDVSGLYECGENDHMMVVGLSAINKEGYRPLEMVRDRLRAEVVRDKKAEKIQAMLKDAGATSYAQVAALEHAVTDSVKHVTFSASAYVSVLRSSEPMVSAYASIAADGEVSAPIKGNGGVYVLQQYAKESTSETYNEESEISTVVSRDTRLATQFVNDLYLKANVKDRRYLFF